MLDNEKKSITSELKASVDNEISNFIISNGSKENEHFNLSNQSFQVEIPDCCGTMTPPKFNLEGSPEFLADLHP